MGIRGIHETDSVIKINIIITRAIIKGIEAGNMTKSHEIFNPVNNLAIKRIREVI